MDVPNADFAFLLYFDADKKKSHFELSVRHKLDTLYINVLQFNVQLKFLRTQRVVTKTPFMGFVIINKNT